MYGLRCRILNGLEVYLGRLEFTRKIVKDE